MIWEIDKGNKNCCIFFHICYNKTKYVEEVL